MAKASRTLKRLTLELGGKSPNMIFPDADLEGAVDGSLFGDFLYYWSIPEARSRLFIHEAIYDAFMENLFLKLSN